MVKNFFLSFVFVGVLVIDVKGWTNYNSFLLVFPALKLLATHGRKKGQIVREEREKRGDAGEEEEVTSSSSSFSRPDGLKNRGPS